jgi:hypothetical protein
MLVLLLKRLKRTSVLLSDKYKSTSCDIVLENVIKSRVRFGLKNLTLNMKVAHIWTMY